MMGRFCALLVLTWAVGCSPEDGADANPSSSGGQAGAEASVGAGAAGTGGKMYPDAGAAGAAGDGSEAEVAGDATDAGSTPKSCPTTGPAIGYEIGNRLPNIVVKSCDGQDYSLDELCGAKGLWILAA